MKTYVWTILALTLIVFACKKFSSETTSKQSTLFHIENAKEWFYGVFKKTSEFKYGDANAVFNADKQPIKKTPDWRYAIQYKAGDLEIVEMPLFADRRNVFIPNAKGVTENDKVRIARATIENILFVKGKDGVIKVRIVQLIPDVDYASSKNFDISNNSANHIDKEFDGWIVVRDWMGKISRFSKIENGRIVKSLENTPSNQFKKSNSREVCGWVQVEIERRTCIIVNEIGDVAVPNPDECTNYSVSYTYDWRWDCTDDGSDEIDCTTDAMPEVCFCNVYGICGEEELPVAYTTIKNNLHDPCISSVFDAIGNQNLTNTINTLLSSFGSNAKLKFEFSDDWTGGNEYQPAITSGVFGAGGLTGFKIKLNGSVVSKFSKELIGEILHHEIVHAWLGENYPSLGDQLNQHQDMLNTFLNDLVNADLQVYPNYDQKDAYANALYGLAALKDSDDPDVKNAFNAAMQKHNLTWDQILETYKKYSVGNSQGQKQGSRCQ